MSAPAAAVFCDQCGLRLAAGAYQTVEEVSWTITAQPQIRVVPAEDAALHGAPLAVETTVPGTAEVTYHQTFGDQTAARATVEITVGGAVDIGDDGAAVWSSD